LLRLTRVLPSKEIDVRIQFKDSSEITQVVEELRRKNIRFNLLELSGLLVIPFTDTAEIHSKLIAPETKSSPVHVSTPNAPTESQHLKEN